MVPTARANVSVRMAQPVILPMVSADVHQVLQGIGVRLLVSQGFMVHTAAQSVSVGSTRATRTMASVCVHQGITDSNV